MPAGKPLLIMQARQLQRRRLLGGVNYGQIVMRLSVFWRELYRAPKRGLRGSAQSLFHQGHAEVLKCIGILWIELRRSAEQIEGFVVFMLANFDDSKQRQTYSIIRITRQRAF